MFNIFVEEKIAIVCIFKSKEIPLVKEVVGCVFFCNFTTL